MAVAGFDASRSLIALGLIALAERCEQAPHMSRAIDGDLKAVEGAQFSQNYTGSLDAAKRLVPDGYVWCVACDEDLGVVYSWANVHDCNPLYGSRVDHSTRGATPELALCAASMRARASAMSADASATAETAQPKDSTNG